MENTFRREIGILNILDFIKYFFEGVILGQAVLAIMTFKEYVKSIFPILLLLSFAFYVFLLIAFYKRLRGKKINKNVIKRSVKQALAYVNVFIIITASVFCFALPYLSVRNTKENTDSKQVIFKQSSRKSLKKNCYYAGYSDPERMENLKFLLFEDEYQNLSFEDKCSFIESVIYWESGRLGLDHINVKVCYISSALAGYFNEADNVIVINKICIDYNYSSKEMARLCLHETYHHYQNSLINLYRSASPEQRALRIFEDLQVDRMYKEFQNYVSAEDDPYLYNLQFVELEADRYADDELKELIQAVRENYPLSYY